MGWFFIDRTLSSLNRERDLRILYRRYERFAQLGFMLSGSRRKLLLSNLRIALEDADESKIQSAANHIVRHIGRGFVDVLYHTLHPGLLPEHVRLEGNGVIDEVLSVGKGCIVATGHVGTFPWIGVPIVKKGVPFGAIARDPHDERLKDLFNQARTRIGYTNIPDRPPLRVLKRSLQILRKGGAVMIAFDMHPGEMGGLEVDFLGRRTPMFSAVIRLAARSGVPVVPGHVLWEPDGMHHRATYYTPITVPEEADVEDCPVTRELLQGLAHWLSGIIRRYPDQWWGLYRRWR